MAANRSAWRRGYLPEMTRIRNAGGTRFHNNHGPHGHVDPQKQTRNQFWRPLCGIFWAAAASGRRARLRRCAGIRNETVDTTKLEDKLVQIVRINVVAGFDESAWQRVSDLVQYAVLEGGGQSI
jgi:hypothetical protein